MKKKARWANVICDHDMKPYMLIVTDGEQTFETDVSSSKIQTVKKAAYDVYDVPKNHILVTQVLKDDPAKQ